MAPTQGLTGLPLAKGKHLASMAIGPLTVPPPATEKFSRCGRSHRFTDRNSKRHFTLALRRAPPGAPERPPRAATPRPRLLRRPQRRAAAPPAGPSARHRAAPHGPPGAGRAPPEGGGEESARGGAARGKLGGTGCQTRRGVARSRDTPPSHARRPRGHMRWRELRPPSRTSLGENGRGQGEVGWTPGAEAGGSTCSAPRG